MSQARTTENGARGALSLLALSAIVLLGLALRLYRIGEESVCLEEYVCVAHLDSPDLVTFIQRVRASNPPIAPLAFAATYVWSRVVGASVVRVRLLFVIIGTLLMPLVYVFAREIYGRGAFARRAGLVAALCVALSPVHIFRAQEIRHYGPLTLLALVSLYCFLRVLREERLRWWALNILANILVVWTHLFGVLLLFTQGLFLVLFRWRKARAVLAWVLVHLALLIPVLAWVMTKPFEPENIAAIYLRPGLRVVFYDLVGDDIIHMASQLFASGKTWGFLPQSYAQPILSMHAWFDKALVAFFCVCIAWGVWRMIRRKTLEGRGSSENTGAPAFEDYALLLMWLIVPPLTLYVLSNVWRPCYQYRYTVYHSLALYILVGGTVASIRRAGLRACAVAALVGLYAYQLTLVLPGPTRTDWKSVARHIESNGSTDDLVLVEGGRFWRVIFEFNMGAMPNPVCGAFSTERLADMADFFLRESARIEEQRDSQAAVWVIVPRYAHLRAESDKQLEEALYARRLSFTMTKFYGERHILLYRVEKEDRGAAPAASARGDVPSTDVLAKAIAEHPDDPSVTAFQSSFEFTPDAEGGPFTRLGITLAEKGALELAGAAFAQAVRVNPACAMEFADLSEAVTGVPLDSDEAIDAVLKALEPGPDDVGKLTGLLAELRIKRDYDAVLTVARRGIELDPRYATGYAHVGAALEHKGDADGAIEAFQKALELDPNQDVATYVGLGTLLRKKGRHDEAAGVFRQGTGRHPTEPWMYVHLGTALLDIGEYGSAISALQEAVDLDPPDPNVWGTFGQIFVDNADYDRAVPILERAVELDPQNASRYWTLWRALAGKGDDPAASKAVRKALELDSELAATWGPLMSALYETKDYDAAWSEVRKLRAAGTAIPSELMQKLVRDSGRQE